MRQGSNDFALHGDSVLIDFLVEGFAQSDGVLKALGCKLLLFVIAEPESHVIEEVKPPPINKSALLRLIFGPEENGGTKDPLETLHDSAVMPAVFRQAEEVEHLGSTLKPDAPTRLLNSESRNPNRDEAILTKGQAESRMPGYIKKELAVASGVGELILRWAAKWNPTENEGASIVSESLPAVFSLFADEADGLELLEPELDEANGWHHHLKRGKAHFAGSDESRTPPVGTSRGMYS